MSNEQINQDSVTPVYQRRVLRSAMMGLGLEGMDIRDCFKFCVNPNLVYSKDLYL